MGAISTNPLFSMAIALVLSATYLFPFSLRQADRNGGFSVELIHRDSPMSPLYNPSETPSRVRNALQHSINCVDFLSTTSFPSNMPKSTIISDMGEYLMKISIGTPPWEFFGVADTDISCSSSECQSVNGTSSLPNAEEVCHYRVSYGDGSYSKGILATEGVTFGSTTGQPVSLPKMIFGCGQDNEGLFNKNGSGMIGLARGSVSLISQMSSSVNGKFSYCLVQALQDSTLQAK
ncbi:hypothetical protein GBA52_024481 [Prunus armeniaca]|nr:hypothetical protein GBA52_024481 [Prunus armeniaca]